MNLLRDFKVGFYSLVILVCFNRVALAGSDLDRTCLDHGKPLEIINAQVLQWKTSTANAFLARARIEGTVDQVLPDHSGHRHFSLKIGPQAEDHIEVIYNLSFGHLPNSNGGRDC